MGSKELVANLPLQLGVGPGESVAYPEIAYPTYEIGAILAKADAVPVADPRDAAGSRLRLAWINYPTNPTGEVASIGHLRGLVRWARDSGVVLASDECYLTLGWDEEHPPVSILDPRVNDGDLTGLLAAHSLSKRSNLAGYRSAFLAGDPELIADLLEIRRHAGFMVPWAVQQATIAALHDESHAIEQRARYEARRAMLRVAVEAAGFRIDHSNAGLYLWATRGEDCWATVEWLADRGQRDGMGDVRQQLAVGVRQRAADGARRHEQSPDALAAMHQRQVDRLAGGGRSIPRRAARHPASETSIATYGSARLRATDSATSVSAVGAWSEEPRPRPSAVTTAYGSSRLPYSRRSTARCRRRRSGSSPSATRPPATSVHAPSGSSVAATWLPSVTTAANAASSAMVRVTYNERPVQEQAQVIEAAPQDRDPGRRPAAPPLRRPRRR